MGGGNLVQRLPPSVLNVAVAACVEILSNQHVIQNGLHNYDIANGFEIRCTGNRTQGSNP